MNLIYIDILFIINFFTDINLLIFTAIYRNLKLFTIRIFIAAICGAIYGTMWAIYNNNIIYTFIGKIIFSLLLIYIAFSSTNFKQYLYNLHAFYLINIITAGCVITLQMLILSNESILSRIIFLEENLAWVLDISASIIVFSMLFVIVIIKNIFNYYKKQNWLKNWVTEFEVKLNNKNIIAKGLIDTGNQLFEPLTFTPVSIIEYELIKEMLPDNINDYYKSEVDIFNIYSELSKMNHNFKYITLLNCHGINSKGKNLLAFKPDQFLIKTKEGDKYSFNSLIAITTQKLSKANEFRGIIHPHFLDN